jgi:ABC-type dipeptide/oligopeptide/nickel transport system permease component
MSRRLRFSTIARRTAWQALPTVIGIVILNFFLLKLMPGDAADVIAGESGSATVETARSSVSISRSCISCGHICRTLRTLASVIRRVTTCR